MVFPVVGKISVLTHTVELTLVRFSLHSPRRSLASLIVVRDVAREVAKRGWTRASTLNPSHFLLSSNLVMCW